MENLFAIPFKTLVTRFKFLSSDRYSVNVKKLKTVYPQTLVTAFKQRKEPRGIMPPKIRYEAAEEPEEEERPLLIDPINEEGVSFQLGNGNVFGRLQDPKRWEVFCFYLDNLLDCYESLFHSSCQEYLVQISSVLRLKGRRNYDVMAKLAPEIASTSGLFKALHHFGSPKVERMDFSCTLHVPGCEFIYDIQAPANEDHTTLWVEFSCRTPQEELTDQEQFRSQNLFEFLQKGQCVISELLKDCDFERR